MVDSKTEVTPELDTLDASRLQSVDRDSVRQAHTPPVTSNGLIDQYLKGRLSMGQLIFELKKLNDVTADSIIKDGKKSQITPINYKEVPRSDVAHPGQDLHSEEQVSKPKTLEEAKKAASSSDDGKVKRELEHKVDTLRQQRAELRAREVLNFVKEKDGREQSAKATTSKRTKEEKELNEVPDETLAPGLHIKVRVRSALSGILKLLQTLMQLLDKQRAGAGQQGR